MLKDLEIKRDFETRVFDELSEYQLYFDEINNCLRHLYPKSNRFFKKISASLNVGGKRIRGILALLACEAVSGDYRKALQIATAYEAAHTAALIQDDIIDDSSVRRGELSLHARHGIPAAILISDVLIFEVFGQLAQYANLNLPKKRIFSLLQKIYFASKAAAYGEYLDLLLSEKEDVTMDEYLEMVKCKTGSLLAAPAACGAIVGNGSSKEIALLQNYGEKHGVAYQIIDDVIDIIGDEKTTGKPVFNDIKNKKKNAVLVHFLEMKNCPKNDVDFLKGLMGKKDLSHTEMTKARNILFESGSIDFVRELAIKIANEGKGQIHSLDDSPAKRKLLNLSNVLVQRYR